MEISADVTRGRGLVNRPRDFLDHRNQHGRRGERPGAVESLCLSAAGARGQVHGAEALSQVKSSQVMMFQKGIRGGVNTISKRYAKANNKYMKEAFAKNIASSYITYLDANNLYGWEMSKPLPTHGFKWMKNFNNQKEKTCILKVYSEYPEELHNLHNDYPLTPEQVKLKGCDVTKLIPNLNNQTKYVVYHEILKLYEGLGLQITKIHREINFQESAWLKKYIDLNTAFRTKATNNSEKDFFKLMNNSVFGKKRSRMLKKMQIIDWLIAQKKLLNWLQNLIITEQLFLMKILLLFT